MSQPTHTIKLRDGKAEAEPVTKDQLAQLEQSIVGFKSAYEVTPIEVAEKPAALPKAEKNKPE